MPVGQVMTLSVALTQGHFSLDVAWEGQVGVLGLFGPSGSGKTTVLEVTAGLRLPLRGCIRIGSRTLLDTAAHVMVPPRERGVGYVPQEGLLFPHLSVRQNALYGAARGGTPALETVMEMLEISALTDRDVNALSGGERQRVALARALLSAPSLLLLDEPLSAVDVPRRRRVLARLRRWIAERGLPAIHVSHDAPELMASDHVLVLENGRVVNEGPPASVLDTALP